MDFATTRAARRREVFWQLVRYGIVGGMVTLFYDAVFVGLDTFTGASLQLANLAGYVAAVGVGYLAHSRVTFRDHGSRGRGSQVRFVVGTLPSYALNAFWAWLLAGQLGLPHWTVQLPIWFVTPLLVFAINRWWVFR